MVADQGPPPLPSSPGRRRDDLRRPPCCTHRTVASLLCLLAYLPPLSERPSDRGAYLLRVRSPSILPPPLLFTSSTPFSPSSRVATDWPRMLSTAIKLRKPLDHLVETRPTPALGLLMRLPPPPALHNYALLPPMSSIRVLSFSDIVRTPARRRRRRGEMMDNKEGGGGQ